MRDRITAVKEFASKVAQFKLAIMVFVAIAIALLLTVISVNTYIKSGVANLDLSRPGYEQAREQIRPSKGRSNFSANGPVDEKSLREFKKLYQAEMKQLIGGSSFSDSSLEDEQLRLVPTQSEPTGE